MSDRCASIWRCPVCNAGLSGDLRTVQCPNKHAFDLAREGYLNLLPVQKRKSLNPGDSKEMMLARREFLANGHYLPLIERFCAELPDTGRLLDLGCGEGYYSRQIARLKPGLDLYGVDISKEAVRLAAKQAARGHAAVASAFDLPIESDSFDSVLTVFAPVDFDEIYRILTPHGRFIRVSPGSDHLQEIRATIYDQVIPHEKGETVHAGFRCRTEQTLRYQFSPSNTQELIALVQMTPHYWKAKADKKAQLEKQPHFSISADFLIQVWEKQTD